MRAVNLLLACVVSTFLNGCGSYSNPGGMTSPIVPPPTDSVSGTVTFKGSPLAGAKVTAWDANTNSILQTTSTDAGGNYTFSGISAGGNVPLDMQFWVTKAGYGFYPSVGSGAKVIRFDHTGNMVGTLLPGIYLTLIDFTAVPNDSLTGADFTAYNGSAPLVSLARTGQTESYSSGDDGSLRRGIAWPNSHYTDNENGTVTDNLTGLVWLKNAACFAPAVFDAALTEVSQLASSACGLSDGSTAGQWRVPNQVELESMIDASANNPAISTGSPFSNLSGGNYWSSTSYFGGSGGAPQAWVIRMSDGRYVNDSVNDVKTSSLNGVWAVRNGNGTAPAKLPATGQYVSYRTGDDGNVQAGIPLTYPRFVDNGDGTAIDTLTGLVWLKMANCIQGSWASALNTVNQLATGQCGLSDGSTVGAWRMPNRKELLSLQDRMENNHADFFDQSFIGIDSTVYQLPIFNNFVPYQYYWTSTTDAANISEAWTVFSCDFGVYDMDKLVSGYTLAVR